MAAEVDDSYVDWVGYEGENREKGEGEEGGGRRRRRRMRRKKLTTREDVHSRT